MNVGEHDRQIANLVMIGVVDQLDEENQRVRVQCDGMLTDWIPWAERRAGPGVQTWEPPEEGEQVGVFSPYGDPAQGFVLGSIYQDKFPSPAKKKTVWFKRFADGTFITYDRETHALTVDATASKGTVTVLCDAATVKAATSVTLDAPKTLATGDLEVTGGIKAGKEITTPEDIKAGDISVKKHHHTAQGATAPTTPSQA